MKTVVLLSILFLQEAVLSCISKPDYFTGTQLVQLFGQKINKEDTQPQGNLGGVDTEAPTYCQSLLVGFPDSTENGLKLKSVCLSPR